MQKKFQGNAHLLARLSILFRFTILVFLGLCVQTVHAQSKCVKGDDGFVDCDISLSLIAEYRATVEESGEWAWQITTDARLHIIDQVSNFSELWCEITLGKSRIRRISVYTDYRKESADIALYEGGGRPYSHGGGFPMLKPSVTVYYRGADHNARPDMNLGKVMAHEFAHASLKVYDEYPNPEMASSPYCSRPLASDVPPQTIMNDHTKYKRFSHPMDYEDVAETAHWRCYGESAWDILLQPRDCDSTLPLQMRANFPRQDYLAVQGSCAPPVPEIDELMNPRSNEMVQECITTARENLEINFISGSENIVIVLDSSMRQAERQMVAKAMNVAMEMLTVNAGMQAMDKEHLDYDKYLKTKFAVVDFNAANAPDFTEVMVSNMNEISNTVGTIMDTQSSTSQGMNDILLLLQTMFSEDDLMLSEDYSAIVMISDTETMPSDSTMDFFVDNGIAIHTIAMGKQLNLGMKALSSATGGDYYNVSSSSEEDSEFLDSIIRQILTTEMNIQHITFSLPANGTKLIEIQVPGDMKYGFNVSLGTENFDSHIDDISVIAPDGSSRTAITTYNFDGHFLENYSIDLSSPGLWRITVTGSGDIIYTKLLSLQQTSAMNQEDLEHEPPSSRRYPYSDLYSELGWVDVRYPANLSVYVGTELMPRATTAVSVVYPEPIMISARVQGDTPLIRAKVNAEISGPGDMETVEIELLDDGVSPDAVAEDGLYSGILGEEEYGEDGVYAIIVAVSDPNGEAIFSKAGVAALTDTEADTTALEATTIRTNRQPRRPPPPHKSPTTLPDAQYAQVDVSITQPPGPNTNYRNAIDIPSDGRLSWGVIDSIGQTRWYRFKAHNDADYHIQTSNLQNFGVGEVRTNLKLYEQGVDGGDPLFLTSFDYAGNAPVSHIKYELERGKYYLVSVNLEDDGSGIYAISVTKENSLLSSFAMAQVSSSIASSSGGGGSTDYLLLLLLLIVCGAFFIWRRSMNKRRTNAVH